MSASIKLTYHAKERRKTGGQFIARHYVFNYVQSAVGRALEVVSWFHVQRGWSSMMARQVHPMMAGVGRRVTYEVQRQAACWVREPYSTLQTILRSKLSRRTPHYSSPPVPFFRSAPRP